VDAHCRTMVACNLRQQQLQQSDHLIKRCRHWSPAWQDQAGWCLGTAKSGPAPWLAMR
jgi:hypothetical protein